jgi:hypothetical protein
LVVFLLGFLDNFLFHLLHGLGGFGSGLLSSTVGRSSSTAFVASTGTCATWAGALGGSGLVSESLEDGLQLGGIIGALHTDSAGIIKE